MSLVTDRLTPITDPRHDDCAAAALPNGARRGERPALFGQIGGSTENIRKRTEILHQGTAHEHVYAVVSGWCCRYATLADGRRQIVAFLLPGELFGLDGLAGRPASTSVYALTDATVTRARCAALLDAACHSPALARRVVEWLVREEKILARRLVGLGRLTAIERTADLLLELALRLERAGVAADGAMSCPITQDQLADALGLTPIHVNRVLRVLRERRLATLRNGRLVILDRAALEELAQFDGSALD